MKILKYVKLLIFAAVFLLIANGCHGQTAWNRAHDSWQQLYLEEVEAVLFSIYGTGNIKIHTEGMEDLSVLREGIQTASRHIDPQLFVFAMRPPEQEPRYIPQTLLRVVRGEALTRENFQFIMSMDPELLDMVTLMLELSSRSSNLHVHLELIFDVLLDDEESFSQAEEARRIEQLFSEFILPISQHFIEEEGISVWVEINFMVDERAVSYFRMEEPNFRAESIDEFNFNDYFGALTAYYILADLAQNFPDRSFEIVDEFEEQGWMSNYTIQCLDDGVEFRASRLREIGQPLSSPSENYFRGVLASAHHYWQEIYHEALIEAIEVVYERETRLRISDLARDRPVHYGNIRIGTTHDLTVTEFEAVERMNRPFSSLDEILEEFLNFDPTDLDRLRMGLRVEINFDILMENPDDFDKEAEIENLRNLIRIFVLPIQDYFVDEEYHHVHFSIWIQYRTRFTDGFGLGENSLRINSLRGDVITEENIDTLDFTGEEVQLVHTDRR